MSSSRHHIVLTLTVLLSSALLTPTRGGENDVAQLLSRIPADYPLVVVLRDFVKLDRTISAWQTRLDPSQAGDSLLKNLKSEMPFADSVDFSKPIGIGIPHLMGNSEGVLFMRVTDLNEKIKALEGATETEGIWEIPLGETDKAFVKISGDYAVFANDRTMVAQAAGATRFALEDLKPGLAAFADRDVFVHLNAEPMRMMALGAIAQASQMVGPLLMMAAAQQGAAANPESMMASIGAMIASVKRFVEQVAYIDIVGSIDEKAANFTLATGFNDGPIKNYLATREPAGRPLLASIEKQPYLLAAGYHFPGHDSPFVDYFFGQALDAMPKPTPSATEPDGDDAAADTAQTARKSVEISRELYRQVLGVDAVVALGEGGMRMAADYAAKDPKVLFEFVKKSLADASSLMNPLGAAIESLGEKKIGGATVEQYVLKIDAANPQMAPLQALMGSSPRITFGTVGSTLRFGVGNDEYLGKVFGKVSNPLAATPYVRDALAALPAKRNGVLVLDIAGAIAIIGPIFSGGAAPGGDVPPGPPVAASFTFCQNPARVDIHIPIRAIERIMQATGGGGDDSM